MEPTIRNVKVDNEPTLLSVAEKQFLSAKEGLIQLKIEQKFQARDAQTEKGKQALANTKIEIARMTVLLDFYADIIVEERLKIVDDPKRKKKV